VICTLCLSGDSSVLPTSFLGDSIAVAAPKSSKTSGDILTVLGLAANAEIEVDNGVKAVKYVSMNSVRLGPTSSSELLGVFVRDGVSVLCPSARMRLVEHCVDNVNTSRQLASLYQFHLPCYAADLSSREHVCA
jgi:hypothetical protein